MVIIITDIGGVHYAVISYSLGVGLTGSIQLYD